MSYFEARGEPLNTLAFRTGMALGLLALINLMTAICAYRGAGGDMRSWMPGSFPLALLLVGGLCGANFFVAARLLRQRNLPGGQPTPAVTSTVSSRYFLGSILLFVASVVWALSTM